MIVTEQKRESKTELARKPGVSRSSLYYKAKVRKSFRGSENNCLKNWILDKH